MTSPDFRQFNSVFGSLHFFKKKKFNKKKTFPFHIRLNPPLIHQTRCASNKSYWTLSSKRPDRPWPQVSTLYWSKLLPHHF